MLETEGPRSVTTEVTYSPSTRPKGFTWGGFSPRAYLELAASLVATQFKVRYRYTVIGLGWAVLDPILLMFVYGYVFGSIFSAERANFKLFLLAGLLPWRAFATGITTATRSILAEKDLVKKAPFPTELLPVSGVLNSMATFFIVFIVFTIYLAIRGFPVGSNLHWVVLALLIQVMLLTGIALAVSSLNVFYRDIEQLVSFGVWIWFFLTPIVYPVDQLAQSQAKLISLLNPMAVVVSTIRNAYLKGQSPPLDPIIAATAIATAMLVFGWWTFRRLQYELPKAI